MNTTLQGTHGICKITAEEKFPFPLYVNIQYVRNCECGREKCAYIKYESRDGIEQTQSICKINWSDIKVTIDRQENLKPRNNCVVCNSCPTCKTQGVYCGRHKICRHKVYALPYENKEQTLVKPSFKRCKKFI